MSYTMNYVETGAAEAMDEKVEEHGVKVYIDPKALFHIIGTTMDFKEDHISSEFTFENPNATGMCVDVANLLALKCTRAMDDARKLM